MSMKEYIYKQVEGGGLLASVWYKSGAEETGKPIGELHTQAQSGPSLT
jgi:hypothetical protein